MIIQLCLLLKENTSCFSCDNIRQMYPLLLLFSTREVKTKSPTLHHRYENGYLTLSSTFVITPRKKKRPTTLVVVGGSHRIEIRRFSMSWVPLYRCGGSPLTRVRAALPHRDTAFLDVVGPTSSMSWVPPNSS